MQLSHLAIPTAMFCGLAAGIAFADPIHEAAKTGNVPLVERLLKQGVDVNLRDEQGNSALHHAVAEAQIEVVNALLRGVNVDVNVRNNKGETPLHLAGSRGRPKTVALLIEKGARIDELDEVERTALCWAVVEGRPETIQVLLDKGADINGVSNEYDHIAAVPLVCAVEGGKRSIVALLLERGAQPNGLALLPVIVRADLDMLKFLLEKGIPISGQAMAAAIASGNREMATVLLNKGGLTDYQALAGYLGQQQGALDQDMLKFVLEKERGAKIRATPLLLSAVMSGNLEQATALINLGVNVNGRDEYGNAPLHRAAEYGHIDIVRLLLTKGAQINPKTERGNTPLHKAVVGEQTEVVKLLVAKGANVNATNEIKITPLHMAAARNQAEFVGLFLRKGADIKLRSDNGHTAGEVALNNGHEDLARVLGMKPTPRQPPVAAQPAVSAVQPGFYSDPTIGEFIPSASGLRIRAPDRAENGAVVPFSVDIDPALRAGDRLTLLVNTNDVACTIQPQGNVGISGFSTRVRMSGSGLIRAVVTRQNGTQAQHSQAIGITAGATIPRQGNAGTSYKSKTRTVGKTSQAQELLILINNDMAQNLYIGTVLVKLPDGAVEISATPWLSSNPLIGFKTANSLEGNVVTVLLHQP